MYKTYSGTPDLVPKAGVTDVDRRVCRANITVYMGHHARIGGYIRGVERAASRKLRKERIGKEAHGREVGRA